MFPRSPLVRGHVAPPADGARWPSFPSLAACDAAFAEFRDYVALVLGHSPATVRWLRDGYASFRRSLPDDTGALALAPVALEQWLAWLRAHPVSPHSLRTYWNGLKRFVDSVAAKQGCLSPFGYVPSPGLPQHVYKALPPSACERILAAAQNFPWPDAFHRARNTAMLATALYAGLRKREILRLEVLDVDLDEGTIQVRRGKGRHGGKDRVAYMPAELQHLLRAYLLERRRRQMTNPEFFASLRTHRGVPDMTFRRIVEQVRIASGVRFSLHVLRHSFVTMLLRSGVPIHIARDLAGHSDIKTTEGYARVFAEDLRQHVQAVRFHPTALSEVDR
jgi:site-specific recombinase XerD